MVSAYQHGHTVTKRLSFDILDTTTRARLIALGVAELARELARISEVTVVPVVPVAAPQRARQITKVVSTPPAWALSLGGAFRIAIHAHMLASGGRMVGERRAASWLAVTLAGEGTTADRSIAGGTLRWNHAAVELGTRAFRVSGLLRLFAEVAIAGTLDKLAGRASEVGVRGDSFSVPNASVRAGMGGELRFLRRGLVALSLDAHLMLRSLRAQNAGAPTTQIGPTLLGANLTAGVQW